MSINAAHLQLALGGWAFFIAENAILSENRTWVIDQLGHDGYYYLFGTCSTLATAGTLYGYRLLRQKALVDTGFRHGGGVRTGLAVSLMSVGLVLGSQAIPQMQIPLGMNDNNRLVVRCPFDFSSKSSPDKQISGLERVSRHSSLWALALTTAGNAALQPTLPLTLWMLGPTAIALLGGAHTDSRFRRGLGGNLDPLYEAQTSHLPFVAMLQQGTLKKWLQEEVKPLNAALAVSVACVWVFATRGRGAKQIVQKQVA